MERPSLRRLVTPEGDSRERPTSDNAGRRSRSRSRRRDNVASEQRRSRLTERSNPPDRDKLREMERQADRERERLRDLQDDLYRERRRIQRTVSHRRELQSRRVSIVNDHTSSRKRGRSPIEFDDKFERRRSRVDDLDQRPKRSTSPSFSAKDVINILGSLKNLPSQPSTSAALAIQSSNNHKNILPDFDPSSKNQRIDIWIKKVNECATVYGWDDKTKIHFAMQKLQGLAKIWYESLPSILFSWTEWQSKLLNAFPFEQNYGQTLEDMLKRKSRFDEPIEVYFYEKLALLNQCKIEGKHAVDCIIHGLSDKTMKSSATTLRCDHPEQLLQFLMSNKDTTQSQSFERSHFKSRVGNDSISSNNDGKVGNKVNLAQNGNIFCYNCKEKGHPFLKCPKPIVKCSTCNKVGHKAENCFSQSKDKTDDDDNINNDVDNLANN